MSSPRPIVVVLAAGEGTRMRSATPKVLHEIAGRTLLGHVLAATAVADPLHTVVVVGHGRELVQKHLSATHPAIETVVQLEQLGTGDAVRVALAALPAELSPDAPVVVLSGDSPLLSSRTVLALLHQHAATSAGVTLVSAVVDDPTAYGRIVRSGDGSVLSIVEERDADETERAVREINSGTYAFDRALLHDVIYGLESANAAGEIYLTDVVAAARARGRVATSLIAEDPAEVLGVNDRAQLAQASAIVRDRINGDWMRRGVSIRDPATTWIDVGVELTADSTIERNTGLHGRTTVAAGAVVGPDTTLTDVVVSAGAHVVRTQASESVIGPHAQVGPFSYLRPGTVLAERAKVGAYVEVKNSTIGVGSKVPHLSYVGDASIGDGSNIGAATIVVNYDGVAKHRTVVGDNVRIGSDTMLVAPVEVGDGAYTAAGSVITADVPAGALGVGRARQRNVDGWVGRRRGAADGAVRSSETSTDDTGNDDSRGSTAVTGSEQ